MSRKDVLQKRAEELRAQIDQYRERGTALLSEKALTEEQRTEIQTITENTTRAKSDLKLVEAQIHEEIEAEERANKAREVSVAAGTNPTAEGRGQGGAKVTREERTYSRDKAARGERSFFQDAYKAQYGSDYSAQQRLARHMQEAATEGELESRATNTASFSGLVVPQYLVEDYALLLRAGRATANVVNRMPLPDQGMSLIIPRGTTGASAAVQATENSNVSSTDEVWANVTVPVVTIAGQQDVSRQSIDRGTPGIDGIVFADLLKAYNVALDSQVLFGSGSAGQALGIFNTAGVTQAAAYAAAATAATFYSKTAGLLASIAGAGTAVTPNVWVMHPRRWYWLTSLLDSANRPIVVPNMNGVYNAMGVNTLPGGYSADNDADPSRPVGFLHGLPVIIDANVQTSIGSGPEDIVYCMDASQAYLWEDNGGIPRRFTFEQTLGNQLTVKLVLANYMAFTAGRYPVAFGLAGGNSAAGFGQINPTF